MWIVDNEDGEDLLIMEGDRTLSTHSLSTDGTNKRDIERQSGDIGENRYGRERFRRVPNPEFVKDICIGEREIGHDELSQQQPPEHRAADNPARALFVPTQRLEPAAADLNCIRLAADYHQIRTNACMSYLDEFKDDVFISYAHRDNKPLAEGKKGWVTHLHETLENVLGVKLGANPVVYRDPKLAGNDCFDETLMREIAGTAVFVLVMSPSYINSDYCRKELDEFCKIAQKRGALSVASRSRLFKVLPSFVPREEIRRFLGDLDKTLGFEFFEIDPDTKRPHEFSTEMDPESRIKFLQKVGDLACDMCDLLKTLKGGGVAHDEPAKQTTTGIVYLAETTSDQAGARDQIKRELLERGYDVLPGEELPDCGPDFVEAVRAGLKKSSLSIHLIGEYSARIPERESRSVLFLQNELAAERAKDGSFARLIWMPDGLSAKDEPQRKFIEELQQDTANQAGSELLQTSLEELKTVIEDKLQKLREPAAAPTSRATGPARIYIICDKQDLNATVELADYLHSQGFVPVLSLTEGEEADIRSDYKENLVQSDAALIWYGSINEGWVRAKLLDLQKAPGFGRTKPFLAKAIYVTGPETVQKKDFRNYEATVLTNFGAFSPAAIQSFVDQIKAGA